MRTPCAPSLALLVLAACARPVPPAESAIVAQWMGRQFGIARAERLNPPSASRMSAYSAIALYEGLAVGSPALRSLAGQLTELSELPPPPRDGLDRQLVAIAAERTVLNGLFRQGFASTRNAIDQLADSQQTARLGARAPDGRQQQALDYGRQIGEAILAWSEKDGFLATRGKEREIPVGPAYWVPTATPDEFRVQNFSGQTDVVLLQDPAGKARPGIQSERSVTVNRPKQPGTTELSGINPLKPMEPFWGDNRLFALVSVDSCNPPPPIPYSESKGSDFYAQAKRVYDVGRTLTPEQKEIAFFWSDDPGTTGTPAGHWLGVLSAVVLQKQLDADAAAELYAKTSIAMADAFIVGWKVKFQYNLVRPVTYIRRHIDPNWQTLLVTPPFPEYISGHSVQSASAAAVITSFLGDVPFDDPTHIALGHPTRHYASFQAAADEAAMSRLYGGIHYPMGNENGKLTGRCIGQWIVANIHTRKTP